MAGILYQGANNIDGRAAARARLVESLARRSAAGRLLARDAERVACACHAMSRRFHLGGKLIVFNTTALQSVSASGLDLGLAVGVVSFEMFATFK